MANVRDFGAAGDGKQDDTDAVLHAIEMGDGQLEFPRGVYRISKTIEIPLDRFGTLGISGSGGTAKIWMNGPGPAFRLIGTHDGTGDPGSVKRNVWKSQRMPTISQIEIEGGHPEADGIELIGTMQPIIEAVLIHKVRNGIRLHRRNRNVLISHSHIYNNTGVGIFLDAVNLHQINIATNHISYNRLGGIRIENSEVRNLQITGNDIEYNNHKVHNTTPEPTAEIYVDTTAEGASVNEVTVASNTIQATVSPGGCNIRIKETPNESRPPGLWSISGNIIGSQENNVHFTGCYGITLTGNSIYSCGNRNVLIEDSRQINLTGNTFRRHTPRMFTGVQLKTSTDILIQGCTFHDEAEQGQTSGASLLEIDDCQRINITGSQLIDGVPHGLDVNNSSMVQVGNCSFLNTRAEPPSKVAVRFQGAGQNNHFTNNLISPDATMEVDPKAKVVRTP